MRSIVMTAGCSGCGTAAVTAAVARQLALQGKKVLLVEATAGLRRMNRLLEIREEALFDFSDLLEGRCALENALLPTRIAELTLLQGPSAIDWVPEAADVQLLREELSGTGQYDALLWYCPPGAGALQKGLLPAAETLVLLTEVTPQSGGPGRVPGICARSLTGWAAACRGIWAIPTWMPYWTPSARGCWG